MFGNVATYSHIALVGRKSQSKIHRQCQMLLASSQRCFSNLFFSFWKYLIKKYQVRLEDMNLNYEGNEGFLKRVTHGL